MRTVYRQPKGSSNVLGGLIVGLLGGLIGVGIACLVGWICSSGGGGGGGSVAGTVTPGQTCSVTNACGQSTIGTYVDKGNGTASCSAVADNSTCPPPTIPPGTGFYANPTTVGINGNSTLYWDVANATQCTIKGDNGFSSSASGSSGGSGGGPGGGGPTLTVLNRYLSSWDHIARTAANPPGSGYNLEGPLGYVSDTPQPGMVPVYECVSGSTSFFSRSDHFSKMQSDCGGGGNTPTGVIWYGYSTPATGRHGVYLCQSGDKFLSATSNCEGSGNLGLLFYAADSGSAPAPAASSGAKGSVAVGPLTQTTTFTLTCEDGTGGPVASKSLRIIVDPHYKEI